MQTFERWNAGKLDRALAACRDTVGHYPSGPKGQCIKRMLSNSYLKFPAIRRALKGPKLKSPWSSCRLGLSGPSLTVAAAPHIIAGTRPKRARTSAGSRPKWARAKWARACIFSNLSQFCFSNSLQGGGRDARKAPPLEPQTTRGRAARGTRATSERRQRTQPLSLARDLPGQFSLPRHHVELAGSKGFPHL